MKQPNPHILYHQERKGEQWLERFNTAFPRKKRKDMREFQHLDYTPFLHSSGYLRELYQGADTKEKKQKIFDYIQRFKVDDEEYKGYYSLYEQIGKDLGYFEDEEYISIPKSLILDYVKEMIEDDGSEWYQRHFFKLPLERG
jgi:N-glycosylase/DNA lyase